MAPRFLFVRQFVVPINGIATANPDSAATQAAQLSCQAGQLTKKPDTKKARACGPFEFVSV